MKIWITRFEHLTDHISIIANDWKEAEHIAQEWLSSRGLPTQRIFQDGPETALDCSQAALDILATQGHSGVACYTAEHGWICIPPNVAAIGPLYLAAHPTKAYKFSTNKITGRTLILARHFKHAWALYRQWAEFHDQADLRVFRSQQLDEKFYKTTRHPYLVAAMQLGVTGVISKIDGEYTVLPTWDENAGEGI